MCVVPRGINVEMVRISLLFCLSGNKIPIRGKEGVVAAAAGSLVFVLADHFGQKGAGEVGHATACGGVRSSGRFRVEGWGYGRCIVLSAEG